MTQIVADRAACVGAGQCALTAPEAFDQDDDGIVVVLTESAGGSQDVALVREAAALCPARAIKVAE